MSTLLALYTAMDGRLLSEQEVKSNSNYTLLCFPGNPLSPTSLVEIDDNGNIISNATSKHVVSISEI